MGTASFKHLKAPRFQNCQKQVLETEDKKIWLFHVSREGTGCILMMAGSQSSNVGNRFAALVLIVGIILPLQFEPK
jgi:hypothetical protein